MCFLQQKKSLCDGPIPRSPTECDQGQKGVPCTPYMSSYKKLGIRIEEEENINTSLEDAQSEPSLKFLISSSDTRSRHVPCCTV